CAPPRVSINSKPCSARKSEMSRRFWGASSTIRSRAPASSLGRGIAARSQASLQQLHQGFFLEGVRKPVYAARKRLIADIALFETERNLFQAHQQAEGGQVERLSEHGRCGGDQPGRGNRRSLIRHVLGLGVAPLRGKHLADHIEQLRGLKWLAQARGES